ncbi:hypothetical protein LPUS_10967 [Lasallia pustulata]|uniref:Uncharacterized protein n=1 Tax=Lasallia pustulata TaxID=136370 RepID=A0A1W5DBA5_9LECA|nr:hypothetical protein LPUS_10967 [Lasallia pustulata]
MESPLITYTLTACHAFLFRTVKDLSRASSSYDDGIEIIRNGMMRTFGVDWHDEGMAVVYTIIDNEAWDWGREEMNTLWRSWREHRQNIRSGVAFGGQGQRNYMQNASQGQASQVQNEPAHARPNLEIAVTPFYMEDSMVRSQRNAPAPLYRVDGWQTTVNTANRSKDRADLLQSGPQPRQPPSPYEPQSPTMSASSESKRNRAKQLVKKVSQVFTNRQQEPRSPEGPTSFDGAMDEPDIHDIQNKPTKSSLSSPMVPARAKATVNLNRALPPLPGGNTSVRSDANSLNNLDTGHSPVSFTPRSSANDSVASSRQDFRNITRDLLIVSTPEPQHAIVNTLEPEKYNPANSDNNSETMGRIKDRSVNTANDNPFESQRQTTWTDLYERQDEATKISHPLQGMVHSQSEGSLAFRRGINTPGFHPVSSKQNGPYAKLSQSIDCPLQSPSRGRLTSRTPSPVKHLDDVPEDYALDLTPSSAKRARSPIKRMFGENGWLGRSASMKEFPTDQSHKAGLKTWGEKLKQRVEDLTDDFTKLIPNPFHHNTSPVKYRNTSKFSVSLDPPTQAKLYSEVELMICATANQYLMTQRREGRMSVDSLVQIMKFWRSKNRPQVIEFQFDQLTQRDLVLYNLKSFRFYGSNAENPLSLNAMMLSWKSMAKEMSVRTFCAPDSVVRKHMHDCYKILEMLGAPLVTFLAFQEIQVRALATMRDEQRRRDDLEAVKFGVEKRWEPPVKGRSSEDREREAALFEG